MTDAGWTAGFLRGAGYFGATRHGGMMHAAGWSAASRCTRHGAGAVSTLRTHAENRWRVNWQSPPAGPTMRPMERNREGWKCIPYDTFVERVPACLPAGMHEPGASERASLSFTASCSRDVLAQITRQRRGSRAFAGLPVAMWRGSKRDKIHRESRWRPPYNSPHSPPRVKGQEPARKPIAELRVLPAGASSGSTPRRQPQRARCRLAEPAPRGERVARITNAGRPRGEKTYDNTDRTAYLV